MIERFARPFSPIRARPAAPAAPVAAAAFAVRAVGVILLAAFVGNVVGVPLHLALEDHDRPAPASSVPHAAAWSWQAPEDSHPTHAARDHERQLTLARRMASAPMDLICMVPPAGLEMDRPLLGRVMEPCLRPPDTVAPPPSQCRGPPSAWAC